VVAWPRSGRKCLRRLQSAFAKKDPAVSGRVPIAIFRGKEIDRDAVLPYQL
jgi:hypothetical protein